MRCAWFPLLPARAALPALSFRPPSSHTNPSLASLPPLSRRCPFPGLRPRQASCRPVVSSVILILIGFPSDFFQIRVQSLFPHEKQPKSSGIRRTQHVAVHETCCGFFKGYRGVFGLELKRYNQEQRPIIRVIQKKCGEIRHQCPSCPSCLTRVIRQGPCEFSWR